MLSLDGDSGKHLHGSIVRVFGYYHAAVSI